MLLTKTRKLIIMNLVKLHHPKKYVILVKVEFSYMILLLLHRYFNVIFVD